MRPNEWKQGYQNKTISESRRKELLKYNFREISKWSRNNLYKQKTNCFNIPQKPKILKFKNQVVLREKNTKSILVLWY